ncbi:TPA: hypothetical protein ACTYB9_005961, partial [Klebsiella michiganensis]
NSVNGALMAPFAELYIYACLPIAGVTRMHFLVSQPQRKSTERMSRGFMYGRSVISAIRIPVVRMWITSL